MPYIHTLTVQLPHILEESNERISKTGRLLHYPIRHPRFTAKGIATRNHVSPDSTHQIWKGRQLLPCKSNFSRGRERRTETTTDSSCNGKSPSSIKQSQEDKRTKEIDCCSVLNKGRTYLRGKKRQHVRSAWGKSPLAPFTCSNHVGITSQPIPFMHASYGPDRWYRIGPQFCSVRSYQVEEDFFFSFPYERIEPENT